GAGRDDRHADEAEIAAKRRLNERAATALRNPEQHAGQPPTRGHDRRRRQHHAKPPSGGRIGARRTRRLPRQQRSQRDPERPLGEVGGKLRREHTERRERRANRNQLDEWEHRVREQEEKKSTSL